MKRTVFTSMAALLLSVGSMIAHHGYAEYDRNALVSLEGTVKQVVWANPHVVLKLETQTKGEYSVEWGAVFQLARTGITAVPVKEGDRLIVGRRLEAVGRGHIAIYSKNQGISQPLYLSSSLFTSQLIIVSDS